MIAVASTRDRDAVHALIERAYRGDSARAGWTHEADLLDGQRTDRAALDAILRDPAQRLMVASVDGATIGCVVIANQGNGSASLGMLAVDPRRQAEGIGRRLVAAAETAAIDVFAVTRMEMSVIARRVELIAWYRRLGYLPTGQTRAFPYDDERFGLPRSRDLDFIILARSLIAVAAPLSLPRGEATMATTETATLAAGCFWCIEAIFDGLAGVEIVESGYIGGHVAEPTYREICGGATGHAEAARIVFDPQIVSFDEIMGIFFEIHDPTQLNRQGNDVGTQYRSAVFPHSPEQEATARALIAEVQASLGRPVVTTIEPPAQWFPAEDYHQEYFAREGAGNPYCAVVVAPKLAKFRKKHAGRLKTVAA